jgi:hypothetical protein
MPVVPTSLEAKPLLKLKQLLEASATFQSWAAATGRVHYVGVTIDPAAPLTRPYAIIGFVQEDGFLLETTAGGATWHYAASGSLLLLLFADVDTATSIADQMVTFTNKTGAIIAEMAAISGGAAGAFACNRFERLEGPSLVDEDEHSDEPDYIVSVFMLSYGGSPTA